MKKTLLTILCAAFGLCAMAQSVKTYNEQYIVTVNGQPGETKDAEIVITDKGNNTIDFLFKNLIVSINGSEKSLGDILIEDVECFEIGGERYFEKEGKYTIPASSLPPDMQMMAMFFKDMDYELGGKMNDVDLMAGMSIHVTKLNQEIEVSIGKFDNNSITYTENLVVTVTTDEGTTTTDPKPTDVTVVYNGDGTINFELKNFYFFLYGAEAPIGSIVMENIPVTIGEDDLAYFTYEGNIVIQPGDMEGIDESEWVGPMLGEIPAKLNGKMSNDKLYVTIDILFGGQNVNVQLGTDDFLSAEGKVYTEPLYVTINGETTGPQDASVTVVDNGDGTINFVLKNFFFALGGAQAPVGNVCMENIPVTQGEDGLSYITYEGNTRIQPGDMEGVAQTEWIGPLFGEIPMKLNGKMNDEKLYVTIDIDMQETMNQVVYVQLGTDDFGQSGIVRNFTEPYWVTLLNEHSSERTANIEVVENSNGTINFTVKDLVIEGGELTIPVGDLTLHYLETTVGEDGKTHFSGERNISIPADKLPVDNPQIQMAVAAGAFNNIPTTIDGWYNEDGVYADINAEKDVMEIKVTFSVKIGIGVGDVNADGAIDIADAVAVLNAMAGKTVLGNADANGDGTIDIADAVKVLNLMAGKTE